MQILQRYKIDFVAFFSLVRSSLGLLWVRFGWVRFDSIDRFRFIGYGEMRTGSEMRATQCNEMICILSADYATKTIISSRSQMDPKFESRSPLAGRLRQRQTQAKLRKLYCVAYRVCVCVCVSKGADKAEATLWRSGARYRSRQIHAYRAIRLVGAIKSKRAKKRVRICFSARVVKTGNGSELETPTNGQMATNHRA